MFPTSRSNLHTLFQIDFYVLLLHGSSLMHAHPPDNIIRLLLLTRDIKCIINNIFHPRAKGCFIFLIG